MSADHLALRGLRVEPGFAVSGSYFRSAPLAKCPNPAESSRAMIVIRRLTDRRRAYTAIFLKGEPPLIFPTSDQEHGRILEIYKQDKPYEGVHNDFTDFKLTKPTPPN
jgi:hypothetical protein